MNKQALTEALASLNDSHSYLVPNDLAEQGYEAWLEVIAAARLVERLLPGECEKCDGFGFLNEIGVAFGTDEPRVSKQTCPSCHGSGQVWDEGIVEAVADAIVAEYRKGRGDTRVKEMARAVLSAIAQLAEKGE